jgi:hypothetical protein
MRYMAFRNKYKKKTRQFISFLAVIKVDKIELNILSSIYNIVSTT